MRTIEDLTAERNAASDAYNAAKVAANPTVDVGTAILTGPVFTPEVMAASDALRQAQNALDAAWSAA